MPTMSPNEAATHSGLSRRSIMRAIETGALTARRNNRNQWQIDTDAFAHWAPSGQPKNIAQSVPTPLPNQIHELIARISFLEVELSTARQIHMIEHEIRLSTELDRDRWHKEAQRSIFNRIFGRAA